MAQNPFNWKDGKVRSKEEIQSIHDKVQKLLNAPMLPALDCPEHLLSDIKTAGVLMCWTLDHEGADRAMARLMGFVDELQRQVDDVNQQMKDASLKVGQDQESTTFRVGQVEIKVTRRPRPLPDIAEVSFDAPTYVANNEKIIAKTCAGNRGRPSLN